MHENTNVDFLVSSNLAVVIENFKSSMEVLKNLGSFPWIIFIKRPSGTLSFFAMACLESSSFFSRKRLSSLCISYLFDKVIIFLDTNI